MTQPDDINHSFGRESVNQSERRARIRTVFTAVAPRYDLMNDGPACDGHQRPGDRPGRWHG